MALKLRAWMALSGNMLQCPVFWLKTTPALLHVRYRLAVRSAPLPVLVSVAYWLRGVQGHPSLRPCPSSHVCTYSRRRLGSGCRSWRSPVFAEEGEHRVVQAFIFRNQSAFDLSQSACCASKTHRAVSSEGAFVSATSVDGELRVRQSPHFRLGSGCRSWRSPVFAEDGEHRVGQALIFRNQSAFDLSQRACRASKPHRAVSSEGAIVSATFVGGISEEGELRVRQSPHSRTSRAFDLSQRACCASKSQSAVAAEGAGSTTSVAERPPEGAGSTTSGRCRCTTSGRCRLPPSPTSSSTRGTAVARHRFESC